MGLDMTLYRNEIHSCDGKEVKRSINAIDWRKANWIHKWFVDNIQNGIDDCGEHDVPIQDLKELLQLIEQVLETGDTARLPPTFGLFFGAEGTNNDYYWDTLKSTATKLNTIINEELKIFDDGHTWFSYQASW